MMNDQVMREATANVPPATVASLAIAGVSLQDWVLIVTLVWLAIQIGWWGYNRYKEIKNGRNGEKAR